MTFLSNTTSHVIAGADVGTTLAGTALWVVGAAILIALYLFTLRSISRAPLATESRTRWIWLVVLLPGIGMILWFTRGRPAKGVPNRA